MIKLTFKQKINLCVKIIHSVGFSDDKTIKQLLEEKY